MPASSHKTKSLLGPFLATRRRRIASAVTLTSAIIFLIVYYAFLGDPYWFDPPRILPEEQQAIRNRLVSAEQYFTEGLMTSGGPFTYHVYQEDVNRWLAMRREIFPLAEEYVPAGVSDPFVVFDPGCITLAARYQGRAGSAVVSADLQAGHRDGGLWLKAEKLRCGSVPLDLTWAETLLAEPVEQSAGELWDGSPPVRGNLLDGLRVGAEARWKNGGMRYRVTAFDVRQGVIDLTIEPLGRDEKQQMADSE